MVILLMSPKFYEPENLGPDGTDFVCFVNNTRYTRIYAQSEALINVGLLIVAYLIN